jgi:DEAD/DEAH box helicase domain-containing protein
MSYYYKELVEKLNKKSAEATIGVLGFKSQALKKHLLNSFSLNNKDRFLADPLFEATFPWQAANESFNDLGKKNNLLSPSMVDALDAVHTNIQFDDKRLDLSGQRMQRDWNPYTHQIKAWETLKKNKSLVVTSGTGSGKTECFMVPIINDLIQQSEGQNTPLEGVQALFLYPLNALINSQRERLLSWTMNTGDNVRFCLYNGNTKHQLTRGNLKSRPVNEVHDRKTLYNSPAPILVTNPTMLEYMLIRQKEKPILEKSQGKLKYIVLDEAHTYIGSAAAELSLLIRRALIGFGVEAKDVRFIATSATIGEGEEAKASLRKYLADIAGLEPEQIEVVDGSRHIPVLPTISNFQEERVEVLEQKNDDELSAILPHHMVARSIREFLKEPVTVEEIQVRLITKNIKLTEIEVLRWLDLMSREAVIYGNTKFLPLRSHLFHKTLQGLWACSNKECDEKKDTDLDNTDWGFGNVYTSHKHKCSCGSPVFELISCSSCRTEHLEVNIKGNTVLQTETKQEDEFNLLNENDSEEGENTDVIPQGNKNVLFSLSTHDTTRGELDQDNKLVNAKKDDTCTVNYGEYKCHSCGDSNGNQPFRHAYLGMPFYTGVTTPVLVESTEPYQPKKGEPVIVRPLEGKKMITFTDSRQATARIAIKLQQEAERNYIRGLIFNKVNKSQVAVGNKEELEGQLKGLEKVLSLPNMQVLYNQKLQELAALNNPAPVTFSFNELKRHITNQTQFEKLLFRYYSNLNGTVFQNSNDLAEAFLYLNFGNRPKKANSLETMGLIALDYAVVNNLNNPLNSDLSLKEWKDFLYICLDFYVRSGLFVKIPKETLNWIGYKNFSKHLVASDSNAYDQYNIRWTHIRILKNKRQIIPKLALLLNTKFNYDVSDGLQEDEIDTINGILQKVWSFFIKEEILIVNENGYQFNLETAGFKSVTKRWLCPVTNKVLNTTFNGYTPNLYKVEVDNTQFKCKELDTFPSIIEHDNTTVNEWAHTVENWLNKNEGVITDLQTQGIWQNITNDIIKQKSFFRVAEHSAQQSSDTLKRYEDDFKKGLINILCCSTTMEMGVDIGGISVVANNNVPPHPSNYLQRAGRAGRRNESRALALTMCKGNPIDQRVFKNPKWPFNTKMKQPYITLDSERIVQRHVNSFAFGYFITNKATEYVKKNIQFLRCKDFFDVIDIKDLTEDGKNLIHNNKEFSVVDLFIEWLNIAGDDCSEYVKRITKYSVLENATADQLFENGTKILKEAVNEWKENYKYINKEIERLDTDDNDPYLKKLNIEKHNHEELRIIDYLVRKGFLPSYGFPTNIITFNNKNVSDYKRQQNQDKKREDNKSFYNEMASRDASKALMEYVPGSKIVLNGQVFTSSGIEMRYDPNNNNLQTIEKATRCRNCGHVEISALSNHKCSSCGNGNNNQNINFLKPKGFRVDYYNTQNGTDVSNIPYVPMEEPWIYVNAQMQPLPNPILGKFKKSDKGELFYHSQGQNRNGYALCLNCGRAEAMTVDGNLPNNFKDHDKLNGGKKGEQKCPANSTQSGIAFGYSTTTDIFSFYLNDILGNGGHLIVSDDNKKMAWSVGVALRYGLASALGINTDELGLDIIESKVEDIKAPVLVVNIFDNNSGGSGFSSTAHQFFNEMFKNAKSLLKCTKSCTNNCDACLLTYDTKNKEKYLDRNIALKYITKASSLLQLSDDHQLLGKASKAVYDDLFTDVLRKSNNYDEIRLFADYSKELGWDIFNSKLKRVFRKTGNITKKLYLTNAVYQEISALDKKALYSLLTSNEVKLFTTGVQQSNYIVSLHENDNTLTYACSNNDMRNFSPDWGEIKSEKDFIVAAENNYDLKAIEVDLDELITVVNDQNNSIVTFSNEMDGTINNFGNQFWKKIKDSSINLQKLIDDDVTVENIKYTDRYLRSPSTLALLYKVISSSVLNIGGASLNLNSEISKYERNDQELIKHNWENAENQEEVIEHLFQDTCQNVEVKIQNEYNLPHYRKLEFVLSNNKTLSIFLDQGFGFWGAERHAYPFDDYVEDQSEFLMQFCESNTKFFCYKDRTSGKLSESYMALSLK